MPVKTIRVLLLDDGNHKPSIVFEGRHSLFENDFFRFVCAPHFVNYDIRKFSLFDCEEDEVFIRIAFDTVEQCKEENFLEYFDYLFSKGERKW